MIIYLYYRISTGKIRISLWHETFEGMLKDSGSLLFQLFHCNVYYDNVDDLNRDQNRYRNIYKNLHFYLVINRKSQPESDDTDNTTTQLRIDQPPQTGILALINEENTATEQLVPLAHSSTIPKPSIASLNHGFDIKDIDEINQRFICQFCKLVL
jgi:hypothetical protein